MTPLTASSAVLTGDHWLFQGVAPITVYSRFFRQATEYPLHNLRCERTLTWQRRGVSLQLPENAALVEGSGSCQIQPRPQLNSSLL